MSRTRVGLGLIAVAAGAAWSTGGYAAVQRGAAALVAAIPFLLIAGGLILLLRVLVPRGALAGPLVLMGAGGLWAVASEGLLSLAVERVVPIGLTIGGVAIAMSNRSPEADLDTGVVTRTAFLFPSGPNPASGPRATRRPSWLARGWCATSGSPVANARVAARVLSLRATGGAQ